MGGVEPPTFRFANGWSVAGAVGSSVDHHSGGHSSQWLAERSAETTLARSGAQDAERRGEDAAGAGPGGQHGVEVVAGLHPVVR